MRKSLHFVAATALGVSLPFPLMAQTDTVPASTAPAKPMSTCEALAKDWRGVEIKLAQSSMEEIADNSAPRATMRAIQDNNALQVASMTLSLMRDHKCPLPKRAPSEVTYMLPAMECSTERLKRNYKAPQCETSAWQPLGK